MNDPTCSFCSQKANFMLMKVDQGLMEEVYFCQAHAASFSHPKLEKENIEKEINTYEYVPEESKTKEDSSQIRIEQLKREMQSCVLSEEFSKAALLRDQIKDIESKLLNGECDGQYSGNFQTDGI